MSTPSVSHEKHREIKSLYVMKALCAFFVVAIHFHAEDDIIYNVLCPIVNVAVPCFFIISGFFLYSGDREAECRRAKRWIRKVLILFVTISAIYLLFSIARGHDLPNTKLWLVALLAGTSIAPHLWYLAAFWEALVIFIILRSYFPKLLPAATLLFFIQPFLGCYASLLGIEVARIQMHYLLNFLVVALPCICSGYMAAKLRLAQGLNKHALILFIMFALLLLGEEQIVVNCPISHSHHSYRFYTLPFALSAFCLALNTKISFPRWLVDIGKKHSANIYYFHMLVGQLILLLLASAGMAAPASGGGVIVVFILSWILSILLHLGKRLIDTPRSATPGTH